MNFFNTVKVKDKTFEQYIGIYELNNIIDAVVNQINNDYKPFYSRMFMAQFPKYDYLFQKRGSYADQIDWRSYVVQSDHQTSEATQTIS